MIRGAWEVAGSALCHGVMLGGSIAKARCLEMASAVLLTSPVDGDAGDGACRGSGSRGASRCGVARGGHVVLELRVPVCEIGSGHLDLRATPVSPSVAEHSELAEFGPRPTGVAGGQRQDGVWCHPAQVLLVIHRVFGGIGRRHADTIKVQAIP